MIVVDFRKSKSIAHLALCLALPFLFISSHAAILENGSFESGLAGWNTNVSSGGAASFVVTNSLVHTGSKALVVSVTNAGSATNAVQLLHSSFTASPTNTYVLRFWANSDVKFADMNVVLTGATPAFPEIPFNISTNNNGYQEYIYSFRASGEVSIGFNFNTSSNNYYLDDVEVLDVNNTNGWDVLMTYLWRWGQMDYAKTNPVGWGSGDNSKSVLLPDGSVLWIFNDSWMANLNFYSNIHGGGNFPRNCAVHQVGTNLYPLSINTFFVPTNPADLFWIGDAVVDNNKVRVLLSDINATSITRLGTAIGTLSDLKLESIDYIPATGPDDYNQVVNGNDGYYYIYWSTNASINPFWSPTNLVNVARAPVGSLSDNSAWRFWDGANWQTNHLQTSALKGLVAPWSFTRLGPSNYVAVYMPTVSLTIKAQFATLPMGPWTPPIPIFNTYGEWGELNYMPNICAGTGDDGIYTICYSDNGSPDNLAKVASDKSYYMQHFIKANLRQMSPYTPFDIAASHKFSGTILGASGIGSSTAGKVFDNDLTTYFDAIGGSGWVSMDLGALNQKILSLIRYCPRANNASRMVGGVFQGANAADFSDAVTLYTVPLTPIEGFFTTVSIPNTTPYRYLRYLGPAGSYCNVSEIQFYGATIPDAPANFTATPGNHQVQLSWSNGSEAISFNVSRAISTNGPFERIFSGTTNTACIDAGLQNGLTYYYRVTAVDVGLASTNVATTFATPFGPPDEPVNLVAVASTNHAVSLSWAGDLSAVGYVIKRSTVSGAAGETVGYAGITRFTDQAPVNGTTYYYVVAATNNYGNSADSAKVSAQPGGYGSWLATSGAVAWWRLNEISGSTALDSVGFNHGTNSSTVKLGVAGSGGDGFSSPHRAAHYNGSDAFTQIPNLIGAGNFTIAFWVRTTASGGTPNWYNGTGLVDGEVGGVTTDFGTALVGGKSLLALAVLTQPCCRASPSMMVNGTLSQLRAIPPPAPCSCLWMACRARRPLWSHGAPTGCGQFAHWQFADGSQRLVLQRRYFGCVHV